MEDHWIFQVQEGYDSQSKHDCNLEFAEGKGGSNQKPSVCVCVCLRGGGGWGWEQGEFFCNSTINLRPPNVFLFNRVIRLCLSIWNRSPEAYKELRASGMLTLQSGRLLQMYKNSCAQNPGLNESVGQWMAQEATKRKLGPEGREGGIILDEMAIQVSFPGNKLTSHLKAGGRG